MKISAIIEARMTSSRLPGKVLMKPNNKTFFEILVKRLRYVKELSSIILATTINKTDDELVKKAKNLKLKVFRGSEHHVVNRVLNAAKKFKAEIILGITADCPLIDPDIVSNTIQMYLKNDVDYVSNGHIRSFPDGMDCQVFSLKILKESYALIKTELEKEHLGLVIRNNIKKFRKITLIAPKDLYWPELGVTLDEYNDFILLKKIINHFRGDYKFSCHDIISFLKKNKKLIKINSHVIRKGDN
jgi:spore coat polysaccharide biosynthesis protein SpsF